MKILNLEIKGFRSLKYISWAPADLNVIIGPNGTGKSNLLRMLELISVFGARSAGICAEFRGYGTFGLGWVSEGISFRIQSSGLLPFWNRDKNRLTYGVELARFGKTGTYAIGEEQLLYFHRRKPEEDVEPFAILDRQKMTASIFDENRKEWVAPEESLLEEETLLSQTAGPLQSTSIPSFPSTVG